MTVRMTFYRSWRRQVKATSVVSETALQTWKDRPGYCYTWLDLGWCVGLEHLHQCQQFEEVDLYDLNWVG